MAALHSEHTPVHLSRLSLQPNLPSSKRRGHDRRRRACQEETGVLDVTERLAVGDVESRDIGETLVFF